MNALEFKLNNELLTAVCELPRDLFLQILSFYPRPIHPNVAKFKFLSHWFFYNIPKHVAVQFILSKNWQKVFRQRFTGSVEDFLSTFSRYQEDRLYVSD